MKDKIKMVVFTIAFVVFVGGCYFAYSYLSDKEPLKENNLSEKEPVLNLQSEEISEDKENEVTEAEIKEEPVKDMPKAKEEIKAVAKKEVAENDKPIEEIKSEPQAIKETPVLKEEVFNKAQDFLVYDKDGNKVKLSDFEGKKIVVNFWATWCGYCVREMPDFEKLYEEKKDEITFLMVNSFGESKETVDKFMKDNNYSFPIYFDLDNEAVNTYNVTGIPVTIVFDEHRQLLKKHVGTISETALRELIEQ